MIPDFDVIIVGSGPAGVSAAFPLLEAGLRVLMVDGGKKPRVKPPEMDFISARVNDPAQWKWMVGDDFHALKMHDAVSPKLRVPTHAYVFDQFERGNRISGKNFITVGSLATGGLSNVWGGGVARFSKSELAAFPCPESEMEASYASVAKRIGISGGVTDDLSDYFGLDEWAQEPVDIDKLHGHLLGRYARSKCKLTGSGFKMGRTRVAVIREDRNGRQACDLLGNCLWGCHRRALYSSADELPELLKYENFTFQSGFLVESLSRRDGFLAVEGKYMADGVGQAISAKKILLAAGTLATTRLVLQSIRYREEIPLLSCPTAAFMLWVPKFLGVPRTSSASIGQLAFTLPLDGEVSAFGSTFLTTGIGMSEFLRRAPLKRRNAIGLFRNLLSSCMVGNLFLPGHLTKASARLQGDNNLDVTGEHCDEVAPLMHEAEMKLRQIYLKLGALLLPGSFTIGRVGGDIHYAGTHPMRHSPTLGETTSTGEVMSLEGVHVVDGACLPTLPAKSHTFTIMANADRISRELAASIGDT
ncbi:FAD-dependent oxidoreductase [Mariprofundus ferrooxydans]|uniref:FAD-dependent oxidoreductase n=1 Tax=Mariprofundus ferrooxydans TaxID=314344 RepID=UPI00036FCED4|nr:FAD-dependent oxidoreductase [Mariprofundus ferrooxydans]